MHLSTYKRLIKIHLPAIDAQSHIIVLEGQIIALYKWHTWSVVTFNFTDKNSKKMD